MVADPSLVSALTRALTGRAVPLSGSGSLPEQLAEAGFDAVTLQGLREQRQEARLPWPFEVPLEERRAIGFARFDAALATLRQETSLTGLRPTRPASRALNTDERRLVADRPPHWG